MLEKSLEGGIAPVLSGIVAEHYGIQNIFYLSLTGTVLGMIISLFIKETAPRKVAEMQNTSTSIKQLKTET